MSSRVDAVGVLDLPVDPRLPPPIGMLGSIISWLPDIPGGSGTFESFMAEVWSPLAQAFAAGGIPQGLDYTARWYFQVPWEEVEPERQTLFSRNVGE